MPRHILWNLLLKWLQDNILWKLHIRELCSKEYLWIMYIDQCNHLRQLFYSSSRKGQRCFLLSDWYVTHTHTHTHNHFTVLWILSRTTHVSQYQKKHSPTHTYCGHQSSLICFLHLLQSMRSSLFNLCLSLFPQSLSKFSLVYLLAWHPPFHTPYSIHYYFIFEYLLSWLKLNLHLINHLIMYITMPEVKLIAELMPTCC